MSLNHTINQRMGLSEWGLLILLSVIWGGSFFFIEILVDHLPPLTIVTARLVLAALVLWIIVLVRKIAVPQSLKLWGALFMIGLLNNAIPFTLIVWGQTRIDSGLASILNATTPLFTVLIAGVLLADEKFSKPKVIGVITGFIGAIILIGPEALGGLSSTGLGQLAALGAALSYGLAATYARRFKKLGLSPLMIATGQVTTAALMLIPLCLWVDRPQALPIPGANIIGILLALALICTVLGYIIYFRLIDTAGATNAALVTFLVPVSAVTLGVVILGETFSLLQIGGMALIGLGLLIMDGRIIEQIFRRAQS